MRVWTHKRKTADAEGVPLHCFTSLGQKNRRASVSVVGYLLNIRPVLVYTFTRYGFIGFYFSERKPEEGGCQNNSNVCTRVHSILNHKDQSTVRQRSPGHAEPSAARMTHRRSTATTMTYTTAAAASGVPMSKRVASSSS